MKKIFSIIMGALLICAGVIFALDTLGIAKINVSFDGWWTLFIIIPSLYGFFTSKDKTGNLIALAVGVYLLLAARGIIEYGMFWRLFVPTVIILIGLKMIVKAISGDSKDEHPEVKDSKTECMAAFTSKNVDYTGENISLAKIGAIFGCSRCNLADANFPEKGQIDVFCMFGGSDIIIPDYVEVKINAFCLFGGISDKRIIKDGTQKTAELTVNGFCLFGGADIK